MEKKKKRGKNALIFITLGIFFFLLLVSIISSIEFGKKQQINEKEKEKNKYKVLKLDPSTKQTSFGSISMFKKLESEEFLSYKQKGVHYLISDLKTDQYKCSGACECLEESRESTAATFLAKRSIYFLVAAVSSIMAVQKAKNYFQEKCVKDLSDFCPTNSIKATWDDCELEGEFLDVENEDLTFLDGLEPMTFKKDGIREYFCKGNCIPSKRFKRDKVIKAVKKHKCERFIEEDYVIVGCKDLSSNQCRSKAASHFLHDHMNIFCKKNGVIEVILFTRKEDNCKVGEQHEVCHGEKNNIRCKQVYPRKKKDEPEKIDDKQLTLF